MCQYKMYINFCGSKKQQWPGGMAGSSGGAGNKKPAEAGYVFILCTIKL